MSGPRILLIARFDDALHAHAAQRRRALERLGCRVRGLDPGNRTGLRDRVFGRDRRTRVLRALEEAAADLVVAIGDPEFDTSLLGEAREVSRAHWVNWFPDDLRTAAAAEAHARDYDQVFAIGSDVAKRLEPKAALPVEVLPFAADPSIYRPLRSRGWYRANVVFAGRATPRREALLAGLVEFGLAIWGPGWRSTSLRDYCRGELLRTAEYVKAYNGATVAVNIHHRIEGDVTEASCNQRVFELAALGAAQVVDTRLDLPAHFEPGRDLLTYTTADELRELVRDLLGDPARVESLKDNARRAALARHTYMHRALLLLDRVAQPTESSG